MAARVPAYFDHLIDAFHRGLVGRFVHLGHWDRPPAPGPGEFERAQARLNDVLLGLADLADGQTVLDVGCGFGGALEAIDHRHRGMRLVGVNIDSRQLALCRTLTPREGNRYMWAQADACRLPFPAASFDCVLCMEAMFHFASRRTFIREAARVLRPGGALVASDMLLAPSAARLDVPGFCLAAILSDGYGPWPDVWGRDADYEDLARSSGLRCAQALDASANTLPSHRFTVPGGLDERACSGDVTLRAALLLRSLHAQGHLRYLYLRFDKPGVEAGPAPAGSASWQ